MPDPDKRSVQKQGLINPMLGFLDRNLNHFSQPVRDTIGVGILLILFIYSLNGLIGSTYIRGQLFVHNPDRNHAVGWKVLLGDGEAVTNQNGWWTLPLSVNGIPTRMRLEVEDDGRDKDGKERSRSTVGEVYAIGPWPVWNTFRPMNNLVIDVYPDKLPGERVQIASLAFFPVSSVYAQSRENAQGGGPVPASQARCALSLNRVKVNEFPQWFKSSGWAYFQIYLDNRPVDANTLLYGPGLGSKAGRFPVQSDKELWLPVRTGSDDRYNGILANFTEVAECSSDTAGNAQIRPKGLITLKMFSDHGDILDSFDISSALAAPNHEIMLSGDLKGRAALAVEILVGSVNGGRSVPLLPKDANTKSVIVQGKRPWTNTGIQIKKGDVISFEATGEVEWATGKKVGPEGSLSKIRARFPGRPYPSPNIGAGGLVGRVGQGSAFVVGKSARVTADRTGVLYLGINDNFFTKNSGQFSVSITWISAAD